MRRKIVAGNWKMNNTLKEGLELARRVNELLKNDQDQEVVVILGTPFIHLSEVGKLVDPSKISISAQNCSAEPRGAFTGEISAEMIASTGARYVILGHSERRAYYHEDDQVINRKVKTALEYKLHPVFCCGEILDQREENIHFDVIRKQLEVGLFDLNQDAFSGIIIAYEPVWAIGTGVNATPEQAQEMHKFIRDLINKKYGKEISTDTSILYGGSCKPSNAKELFHNPDVDGGLIGGASLKADDFYSIIHSF